MDMSPLSANLMHLLNTEPIRTTVEQMAQKDGESFGNILSEAFVNATATDAKDKTSSAQLLTGEADDLSGMLIDIQKAELALQLTLQIRNKILDAYNEVMRMSV